MHGLQEFILIRASPFWGGKQTNKSNPSKPIQSRDKLISFTPKLLPVLKNLSVNKKKGKKKGNFVFFWQTLKIFAHIQVVSNWVRYWLLALLVFIVVPGSSKIYLPRKTEKTQKTSSNGQAKKKKNFKRKSGIFNVFFIPLLKRYTQALLSVT